MGRKPSKARGMQSRGLEQANKSDHIWGRGSDEDWVEEKLPRLTEVVIFDVDLKL